VLEKQMTDAERLSLLTGDELFWLGQCRTPCCAHTIRFKPIGSPRLNQVSDDLAVIAH